jgi:hypothetical protein
MRDGGHDWHTKALGVLVCLAAVDFLFDLVLRAL